MNLRAFIKRHDNLFIVYAILLAVAVGCAYLCVSAYAHGGKDEQAADAV